MKPWRKSIVLQIKSWTKVRKLKILVNFKILFRICGLGRKISGGL